MRDLERELRALSQPDPSPALDERIERLHAIAGRPKTETVSAGRRRAVTLIRSAALLLSGLLLGRLTAPTGQSDMSPETAVTEPATPATVIENDPVVETEESPHVPRADGEPPLFAAANVRPLLAGAPAAEGGPPLFVPPRNARSVLELVPIPSRE